MFPTFFFLFFCNFKTNIWWKFLRKSKSQLPNILLRGLVYLLFLSCMAIFLQDKTNRHVLGNIGTYHRSTLFYRYNIWPMIKYKSWLSKQAACPNRWIDRSIQRCFVRFACLSFVLSKPKANNRLCVVAASMVHGAQKTKKKKHNVESLARPDSQPKQRLDCQYLFGKKMEKERT